MKYFSTLNSQFSILILCAKFRFLHIFYVFAFDAHAAPCLFLGIGKGRVENTLQIRVVQMLSHLLPPEAPKVDVTLRSLHDRHRHRFDALQCDSRLPLQEPFICPSKFASRFFNSRRSFSSASAMRRFRNAFNLSLSAYAGLPATAGSIAFSSCTNRF